MARMIILVDTGGNQGEKLADVEFIGRDDARWIDKGAEELPDVIRHLSGFHPCLPRGRSWRVPAFVDGRMVVICMLPSVLVELGRLQEH